MNLDSENLETLQNILEDAKSDNTAKQKEALGSIIQKIFLGELESYELRKILLENLLGVIRKDNDKEVENTLLYILNNLLEKSKDAHEIFQNLQGTQVIIQKLVEDKSHSFTYQLFKILGAFYSHAYNIIIRTKRHKVPAFADYIRRDQYSEALFSVICASMQGNEDLQLNRFIVDFAVVFCEKNKDPSQRSCLLTILMQCLNCDDLYITGEVIKAVESLVETREENGDYLVDDVIESGICRRFPKLLNCDDEEIIIGIICVFNCILDDQESGAELANELKLLPKIAPYLKSNNLKLRKKTAYTIFVMATYPDITINSFYESDIISQLWEGAFVSDADDTGWYFRLTARSFCSYSLAQIILSSSYENKLKMVREERLKQLVTILARQNDHQLKRQVRRAIEKLLHVLRGLVPENVL